MDELNNQLMELNNQIRSLSVLCQIMSFSCQSCNVKAFDIGILFGYLSQPMQDTSNRIEELLEQLNKANKVGGAL